MVVERERESYLLIDNEASFKGVLYIMKKR